MRDLAFPPFHLHLRLRSQRASALVTTLLVITVLTIIVVAFMQSMSIERMTARSYANIEQARLAAEAGANYAEGLLQNLVSRYPDSATVWLTNLGGANHQATVFYFRATPTNASGVLPPAALPSAFGNATEIRAWPLISGITNSALSGNLTSLFPPDNLGLGSVNLNRNKAMGSRSFDGSTNPPTVEAYWVPILHDPTKTNQPDPAKPDFNPIISRYAFVVEDESFKANWNTANLSPTAAALVGTNFSEVALSQVLSEQGLASRRNEITNAAAQFRQLGGEAQKTDRALNQFAESGQDLEGELRWGASRHGSALNLSRGGVKRLNLNEVVQDTFDPDVIRVQLDKMAQAITNSNAIPLFGQRLHRQPLNATQASVLNQTNLVATTNAAAYVTKITANIRDYVDADIQPTVVSTNGTVFIDQTPDTTHVVGHNSVGNNDSPNAYTAFGKEAGPKFMEVLWRIRLLSFDPPVRDVDATSTAANFDFTLDYYFQFWNPTTKDITAEDLGPGAFIEVSDQLGWDTAGGTVIPPGRPFRLPLTSFVDGNGNPLVFKAGAMTTLTTDDRPCVTFMQDVPGGANAVFRPNASTAANLVSGTNLNRVRRYQGQTFRTANDSDATTYWRSNGYSHIPASRVRALRINPNFQTSGRAGTSSSDYSTKVLLGNSRGIIESFGGVGITSSVSINNDTGNRLSPAPPTLEPTQAFSSSTQFFWVRGSSVRGNNGSGSQRGDGRANAEAISIQKYRSGGDEDQFRTYQTKASNDAAKGDTSFGRHLILNFLTPTFPFPRGWEDYYALLQTANAAPSFIRDNKIETIGELGNVYDPARQVNPNLPATTAPLQARGGGRSLFIGRPEQNTANNRSGLWDGNQTSSSRNWTAWRLVDVFDNRSELQLDGIINPNGLLRDSGASLRAMLKQIRLNPRPIGEAPNASTALSDSEVALVIDSLRSRLQGGNSTYNANMIQPLWERGEISEISAFLPATHVLGNGTVLLDRTLEQIANRLIGLIEPKGNTFTIYSIGEKVDQMPNGALKSRGLSFLRRTIRFTPVFDPPLPASDGVEFPNMADRFRPPARYEITVLEERDF